jgi:heme oxygenase
VSAATPAASGLMLRLRESTAAQHRELEAWVDPARRFVTRESYVGYLREIYALFVKFETALASLPWATIDFDFEARRKAPMIARDLEFFGQTIPETSGEEVTFDSLSSGFGCMYVLEGSTLGGQMILAQLEKRGIGADTGGAFLACYGDRTQAMWKAYKETATAYCADEARQAEAESAARETFAIYRRSVSSLA